MLSKKALGMVRRPQVWLTIAILGILVLIAASFYVPQLYFPLLPPPALAGVTPPEKRIELENKHLELQNKRGELQNQLRTTMIQAAAGVAVLLAAGIAGFFTWQQTQVNRDGQFTERFSKAVEHLGQDGDDKVEVRLGGIYALERIARNSAADQDTIAEVFTAYVRHHARRADAAAADHPEDRTRTSENLPPLRVRAPDIYAIVTILAYTTHLTKDRPPQLPNVDLRLALLGKRATGQAGRRSKNVHDYADLSDWLLAGADLAGARLTGANLENADLRGAVLWRAKLQNAHMAGADLRGAVLLETDLSGADMTGVLIDNQTVLTGARLEGTGMSAAIAERAMRESSQPT